MNNDINYSENEEKDVVFNETKIRDANDFGVDSIKLEKKIKKVEILNYIILLLLVSILVVNLIIMSRGTLTTVNNTTQTSSEKTLPKTIDKVVADKMINEIKNYYNNGENTKLYNVMGDYARTYVSYGDFEKSLSQIKMLGKMISASYINYSFSQNRDGADWFILNYAAKYEKGDGNATITIMVNGNEWQIAGFRFNVTDLTSN